MNVGDDVWVRLPLSDEVHRVRVVYVSPVNDDFCAVRVSDGKVVVCSKCEVMTEQQFEEYWVDTLRRQMRDMARFATPEQVKAAWNVLTGSNGD